MTFRNKLRAWKHVIETAKIRYNIEATKLEWRRRNPNNYTFPATSLEWPSFPMDKVHVGNYSYGGLKVACYTGKEEGLYIGHFCSIATGTKFLLGGEHDTSHLSTYPFKDKFLSEPEAQSKGPIVLEDDVWIGENCLILSGITLRRGTVVAAGSVVNRSTAPYSIVGGHPAKHIKYRFPSEIIEKLMTIDYSKLTAEKIIDNEELLYSNIDETSIETIIQRLQ